MIEIKDIREILDRECITIFQGITNKHHTPHKFSPHKQQMISAILWTLGRRVHYYSVMGIRFKSIEDIINNLWYDNASNNIIYAFVINGEVTASGVRALRRIKTQYRILVSTGSNLSSIKYKAKMHKLDAHNIHHIII